MIRLVSALLLCCAAIAHADTRRLAVVVGNNSGGADERPLRFAETDAGKLAAVLTELGGVAPEDLFLLQGKTLTELSETFTRVKRQIAAHRGPRSRVIVLFYFSGHSDGDALELGRDRLRFSELRSWLATSGADVRVALVDSCRSGALLVAKGGTRGAAFQIRLTDDLESNGEALLTSSAADEVALESREIGGSFFTHHFVSGLRGAADISGDGLVTLNEAYEYAYAHTIATTGETVIGPQHPAYDYRLSGQGELVLTELAKRSAAIEVRPGFERALVVDLARDQVIAELTTDARSAIAVQPGRYAIRAWRGGKMFTGQLKIADHEQRVVAMEELSPVDAVTTVSKGGALPAATVSASHSALMVGGGSTGGVARGLGAMAAVRLELRRSSGFDGALTIASKQHLTYRETSSLALVGYRLGLSRDRFGAWAALDIGGGVVMQTLTQGPAAYSGAFALAPRVGLSVAVAGSLSLALEADITAELIRRDGQAAVVAVPGAWLGALVGL